MFMKRGECIHGQPVWTDRVMKSQSCMDLRSGGAREGKKKRSLAMTASFSVRDANAIVVTGVSEILFSVEMNGVLWD